MHSREKIIAFVDKKKPLIWGLFLATIIFRFAFANFFLVILSVLFIIQISHNKRINFYKSFLPIAAYFLWGAFSLFWTTNFANTIKGIGMTLPLVLLPLLISQYSNFGIDELKKTIRTFGVCLLFYFAFCSINACFLFLQDKQYSHFFYHSLVAIFDNNAIYISLAVALCILFLFNFPQKKRVDFLMLFLLGIFLLVLASKNIIITTALLIALSSIKHTLNLRSSIGIISIISVVVLLVTFSNNPIKERFLNEVHLNIHHVLTGQDFYNYKFSGLEVRIFQWRLMGEMITNNQIGILGLGLHNVNYLLDQYFSYYNLYKGYFHINFHNQYLQTLGEIGFVGLALLLLIFLSLVFKAIRSRSKYEILFVLLFMASFFTESFLSRQKGVLLFATVFSLVISFFENKNPRLG